MRQGFINIMSMLLRGQDVGLKPDFHLIGDKPTRKNREQRREEFKGIKSRK